MRCDKWATFALPEDPEDEVHCLREAEVRIECRPAPTNPVGEPGTIYYCRECASAVIDSEFWVYQMYDMLTGEPVRSTALEYRGVPVADRTGLMSPVVLSLVIHSEWFAKLADRASELAAAQFGGECTIMEVVRGGLVGRLDENRSVLVVGSGPVDPGAPP